MAATPARLPAELATGPTVVKAWAPWCSSCRALAPHVDQAAATSGVRVVDVRVDADPDHLVEALGVRSVPTLIGFHDGDEVARLVGAQHADAVEALFTAAHVGAGAGSVAGRAPAALVGVRGVAGVALAVGGLVSGATVLLVVGVALAAWAAADLVRQAM